MRRRHWFHHLFSWPTLERPRCRHISVTYLTYLAYKSISKDGRQAGDGRALFAGHGRRQAGHDRPSSDGHRRTLLAVQSEHHLHHQVGTAALSGGELVSADLLIQCIACAVSFVTCYCVECLFGTSCACSGSCRHCHVMPSYLYMHLDFYMHIRLHAILSQS